MANSTLPGPLTAFGRWTWFRTPGVLGFNDQADPNRCTLLGDSPGPVGFRDFADPTLPFLRAGDRLMAGLFVRTEDGTALSLPSSQSLQAAVGGAADSITKEQLKKVFPAADDDYLQQIAGELNTGLAKYGLDTVLRRAHFCAQVRQEGGAALEAKVESLNYSPESLKSTFKYYRLHPDEAVTDGYERDAKTRKITRKADQEAVGNKAYADRNGNGDAASGDGWKFRGRGLIQVTGRSNYREATLQYAAVYSGDKVDFEDKPELMAEFPYTVRSAVCFWTKHDLHKLADRGSADEDVDRITAVINRDTDSYGDRRSHFGVAHDAFK